MLKGLYHVIDATYNEYNSNAHSGNYTAKRYGYTINIELFGNRIAIVNTNTAVVELTHCGWYTKTTTRALNDIERFFKSEGFKIVRVD